MKTLTADWTQELQRRREGMIALRRDFHRYPELSFEENRTAGIIADRLHAAKLEVRSGVGRTGVVGVLRGERPGRTIAWRADIDALPLIESLDAPFVSGTRGVMHACGHDGQTAIAITLAELMAARRAQMAGTAVFIFQPAEEVFGGAEPMIAAGVLDEPRVEEIYGLHLTTQTATGQVDIRPGPSMASADFFDVEVKGQGGHGAYPHLSMDPITAAANILLGMQNLVSREISAHAPAVLTVGQFVGGTKHNIIPASAVLRGSLRTFDEAVRGQIKQRLRDYAAHMARAYRTEASLSFMADGCPVVINTDKESAFVHGVAAGELGAAALASNPPVMASDDMSLFLRMRPGCYFRVGISPTDGRPHPHHAPEFEMNEDGLPVGLRLGLAVMLNALGA